MCILPQSYKSLSSTLCAKRTAFLAQGESGSESCSVVSWPKGKQRDKNKRGPCLPLWNLQAGRGVLPQEE